MLSPFYSAVIAIPLGFSYSILSPLFMVSLLWFTLTFMILVFYEIKIRHKKDGFKSKKIIVINIALGLIVPIIISCITFGFSTHRGDILPIVIVVSINVSLSLITFLTTGGYLHQMRENRIKLKTKLLFVSFSQDLSISYSYVDSKPVFS